MLAIHEGVVLYEGDLRLTATGLFSKTFVDRRLNSDNCTLLDLPAPSPWIGGGWTWDGMEFAQEAWWVEEYAKQQVSVKAAQIVSDFESEVSQLKANYTETEIKSWGKQEQEAREYLSNNSTITPLLSSMVSERGDTVLNLATKIVGNADAWAVAYGAALGRKHRRESAISAVDLNSATVLTQIKEI